MSKRREEPPSGDSSSEPGARLGPKDRKNFDEAAKRFQERPARPVSTLKRKPKGRGYVRTAADGDDHSLLVRQLDALGTTSVPFLDDTMASVMTVLQNSSGEVSDKSYNAAVAVFAAVAPRNEAEALLAAQMIAANESAMRCTAMIGQSNMINQIEVFGNLSNKFMRTFVAQTEALAKLRRGGEQTVKVVHVHAGAQAVVADNFNHGGGSHEKNSEQPYGAGAAAAGGALPGPDPARDGVPLPRDAERAVSHSRRKEPRRSTR